MLQQILWTACVTPFSANGDSIDYESLEICLRLQEQAGNGVILFGSTGENLSLTESEKRQIITFVCNIGIKTPIMVGIPSYNLQIALDWINFCNETPIHGYLMSTPIYTKPGIIGQTKWFERLLDKSSYPTMLYNVPSRSGIKLHTETVQNLQNHEKFVAIKDSSGTLSCFIEYKTAVPNILTFCGDDNMMPSMINEGAYGLVSVISNALPIVTRYCLKRCLVGYKFKSDIWIQTSNSAFTATNPIPIKALMMDLGIIKYDSVRLPLNVNDLKLRDTFPYHYQSILRDYNNNNLF